MILRGYLRRSVNNVRMGYYLGGTLMNANDQRIAGFALKSRLPSFIRSVEKA